MSSTSPDPEVLFAQHLAANDKVHRDRALRKLKKYLYNHSSLPNGGFNETELLKIWKGLHYCMWMQDKPLIQEELSNNISSLIHSFSNSRIALLFIKTFYITECREWMSIDKWRMDKFLMMFRNMLTQSFEFLKQKNWNEKLVREFLDFISKYILLDHNHDNSPDGIRFHLADTYLVELETVSVGQLGPKQTVTFLQPWIDMLSGIKSKTLRAFVIKNVFGEIMQNSPVLVGKPRKKGSKKLRVNYRLLADKLLERGSEEKCTSVNRPSIYNLVQNFRDIAENKLPFAPEESSEEEVSDLDDDDIESAVQRLTQFHDELKQENAEGKNKTRKRRKESSEVDEAYGSESSADEEQQLKNEPVSKKKKGKPKAQAPKPRILSKKLQKILKAEEDFIAEEMEDDEDDDDMSDASGEAFGDEFEVDEFEDADALDEEDSEGSFNDSDDDLLYADDEDLEDIEDDSIPDDTLKAAPVKLKSARSQNGKNKPSRNLKHSKEDFAKSEDVPTSPSKTGKNAKSIGNKVDTKNKGKKLDSENGNMTRAENSPVQSTRRKKSKKKVKKLPHSSADFEVAEFPDSENSLDIADLVPSISTATNLSGKKDKKRNTRADKNKNNNSIPEIQPVSKAKPTTKADKISKRIAEFVPETGAKAKCFKKAKSKVSPSLPVAGHTKDTEAKTPTRSDKKRLSFGKNSSVKSTAVKLRGSVSYDPTKTPEQGILRVNPIEPGTVIQVGKQATIKNTLKNTKFPQRMMAMEFF